MDAKTIIQNRISVRSPLSREFLAELLGTFCLMVSGAVCVRFVLYHYGLISIIVFEKER